MDYVTARLTGTHRRVAAHVVHGAVLRQPHARRDRVRRRARDARRRRRRRACRRSCRVDDAVGTLLARRRGRRSACPASAVVYAPTNDTADGRGRDRRVHRGPGRARDRHHERARRRGRRLPHRPRAPDPLDARAVRRPLRRVRGERARRQGARARARATSCTRTTRSATTASTTRSRTLDARAAARPTPGAGGVMFLPWLNGSLAPVASGSIRGGFVNMSLDTTRRRPRARRRRGRRPQPRAGCSRTSRRSPASRSTRSRSSAARPARAQWCQVLADVLDRPVSPLAGPEGGAARAMGLLALAAPRRALAPPTSTAPPTARARAFEPDPARHERYAYRQTQFEAAYAALLPISEALSS